jgi:hypothetical protein
VIEHGGHVALPLPVNVIEYVPDIVGVPDAVADDVPDATETPGIVLVPVTTVVPMKSWVNENGIPTIAVAVPVTVPPHE